MMETLLQGATWDDFVSWLPQLWAGFCISLELTVASLLVGLPLGLLWALGVQSKATPVRALCLILVEIGRGTPALVLIQFIYFGLPSLNLALSSFPSAVIALGWCTGAYTSEIIRAGLDSVPSGHKEAVDALGLSTIDGLRYVILPQGLRVAVPALLGFSILIFQGTSLCFTIALPELVSRAYEIGTNTFFYFPALATAGLFYVAICVPGSFLVSYVEHRAGAYSVR
jgi:polar amino acid transport system permease protein